MTSWSLFGRVLPFALAFASGLVLWQAFGDRARAPRVVSYVTYETTVFDVGGNDRPLPYAPPAGEGSRTWLFIRSTDAGVRGVNRPGCDGCSVRMRVLFGEDGVVVPGNGFSLSPSSYPLIEEAVAAARAIEFTPATKDGRPVPIWANAVYACRENYVPHATGPGPVTCGLSVDKDSARTWDGRPWRVVMPHE